LSGRSYQLEEREAEAYDEIATIQRMIPKGEKTINCSPETSERAWRGGLPETRHRLFTRQWYPN